MMVYNTWEDWTFGLSSSSDIIKKAFQKLDLFPSSSEGVGDAYSRSV
jgi:hypothetical protein